MLPALDDSEEPMDHVEAVT